MFITCIFCFHQLMVIWKSFLFRFLLTMLFWHFCTFFFFWAYIPWSRIFGFSGLAYKRGRGKERRKEGGCTHVYAHWCTYSCVDKHFIYCVISSSFLFLLEQNEMDIFLLANMFFLVAIFSSFIPIVLHPGVSIFVSKFTNFSFGLISSTIPKP